MDKQLTTNLNIQGRVITLILNLVIQSDVMEIRSSGVGETFLVYKAARKDKTSVQAFNLLILSL